MTGDNLIMIFNVSYSNFNIKKKLTFHNFDFIINFILFMDYYEIIFTLLKIYTLFNLKIYIIQVKLNI